MRECLSATNLSNQSTKKTHEWPFCRGAGWEIQMRSGGTCEVCVVFLEL